MPDPRLSPTHSGDTWHTFGEHVVITRVWFERLRREHGERAAALASNTHRIALEHANNERDSWRTRAHTAEAEARRWKGLYEGERAERLNLSYFRVLGRRVLGQLDGFIAEDETISGAIARAITDACELPRVRKQLAEAHLRILARPLEDAERSSNDSACEP